ncbi:helix-turn-helix domain-containing protein [Desulfobulbus elongatus]|uniref:helix-turn-helix domain-containing protein n=1 Tax=Desulfobulbus elongatus TaxID=53332 RepID=UPI0004832356|nr:helix-turn-helix domain-containing protein [Desulfobulbus elongatus]
MTTYRRIEAVRVSIDILRYLAEVKEPATGKDVAVAVDMPHGTVMCHLATLEDERMVRCVGGAWELDLGMAMFWARKKAQLASRIARDSKDLESLGE